MAKYKQCDYAQRVMVAVSLDEQLVPGTLEHTVHYVVQERLNLSEFDAERTNDATGRPGYDPRVLLKVVLLGYSRGLLSSRRLEVSRLIACESDQEKLRHWSLSAPDKEEADLDAQAAWILGRVTGDLSAWKKLTAEYRVDLFCALYLERTNRGVTLSPKTMVALGERGIEIGFDIYAP